MLGRFNQVDLNQVDFNWIDLNWVDLNWVDLDWVYLNQVDLNQVIHMWQGSQSNPCVNQETCQWTFAISIS